MELNISADKFAVVRDCYFEYFIKIYSGQGKRKDRVMDEAMQEFDYKMNNEIPARFKLFKEDLGERAIDVGCGDGLMGILLALSCPKIHIVLVDNNDWLWRKENNRGYSHYSLTPAIRVVEELNIQNVTILTEYFYSLERSGMLKDFDTVFAFYSVCFIPVNSLVKLVKPEGNLYYAGERNGYKGWYGEEREYQKHEDGTCGYVIYNPKRN